MIVVDALRHDRVGRKERHGKSLTPSLDHFAERAVRFDRAYTTQPDTTGATVALMTSHFRRMVTRESMEARSLGALLRPRGIRTIAISSHPYLEVAMGRFETFEQLGSAAKNRWGLSSAAVVEATLRQLDGVGGDRFFLVTHFYDPHAYYLPNPLADFGSGESERYDAEIAFTDHHIGKLLEGITARGMNDSTAIIVVSDHGEEFGEHRYQRHLVRIYDESTRVALLIAAPGIREGLAVQEAMSILDLPPTVLELLGIRPPSDMVGRSRLATLLGETPVPRRPVFVHSSDGRTAAVISENRKLMFTPGSGLIEYYDLATDPGEQNNLADDSPPAMKRMGRQLRSFMVEHRLLAR
jgi:arylsulfatase A-like enzyme